MDDLDRVQEHNERELAAVLAAHSNRQRPANSTIYCLECGEEIPLARREACPGCEYCIECQRDMEKDGGFWP